MHYLNDFERFVIQTKNADFLRYCFDQNILCRDMCYVPCTHLMKFEPKKGFFYIIALGAILKSVFKQKKILAG